MAKESERISEVLRFWFGDLRENELPSEEKQKTWWMKSEEFDRLVEEKFGDLVALAESGERRPLLLARDSSRNPRIHNSHGPVSEKHPQGQTRRFLEGLPGPPRLSGWHGKGIRRGASSDSQGVFLPAAHALRGSRNAAPQREDVLRARRGVRERAADPREPRLLDGFRRAAFRHNREVRKVPSQKRRAGEGIHPRGNRVSEGARKFLLARPPVFPVVQGRSSGYLFNPVGENAPGMVPA